MLKKLLNRAERGQAIIIIAFAMIGLISIVGLMTDGGLLLIEYGKLKRAIDSAAIASAAQFRKNFQGEDLANAAQEFLQLNQSGASNIIVYRCRRDPNSGALDTSVDGTQHAEDLCTTPRRKLLRVHATRTVNLAFLRVIGIDTANISADSVGEAASIDLVLVIDTSSSMSYATGGDGNYPDSSLDDPSVCNSSTSNPCEPMHSIKNVARDFVQGDFLFFPYDRVAIVTMTGQNAGGSRNSDTILHFSNSESNVVSAINGIKVFQPDACNFGSSPATPISGPCLNHDALGNFIGMDCPKLRSSGDPSSCNSSNIGGALLMAGSEFSEPPIREDSFWAVIFLASGPANATNSYSSFPDGYCPSNTWNSPSIPFCRDASASSRHSGGDGLSGTPGDPNYDADDYARDTADWLADPVNGQGVSVYTIGLGPQIRGAAKGDADAAEKLLKYIAETAGGTSANHGFYSYSPDTNGLQTIFLQIASNIFTRISQ